MNQLHEYMEIVNQIAKKIGLKFTAVKEIPQAPFEKGGEEEDEASPLSEWGFRGLNEVTKLNPDMDYMPYNPELKEKARELRNNMTDAEKKIWYELLSEDKMLGFRFLRQKPLTDFIVDFYCSKLLLVIEIDGDSHEEKKAKEYDKQRTKILNGLGIKVIRYTNDQVLENLDWVADDLKKNIEKRINEIRDNEKIPLAPLKKGVKRRTKQVPFLKGDLGD